MYERGRRHAVFEIYRETSLTISAKLDRFSNVLAEFPDSFNAVPSIDAWRPINETDRTLGMYVRQIH